MNAQLQCPICSYVLEVDTEAQADVPGVLAGLLNLAGDGAVYSTAWLATLEATMRAHLVTHTLEEWVLALKMADSYIDLLEAELASTGALLLEQSRMATTAATAPAADPQPWTVGPVLQVQERGYRHVDPDTTLIPLIPAASRPEGVVGRKS